MFKLPALMSVRSAIGSPNARPARRRSRQPSVSPLVESLEDRLLLSHFRGAAMIPSVSAGGLLTLTSTSFWKADRPEGIDEGCNSSTCPAGGANPTVVNVATMQPVGSMVDVGGSEGFGNLARRTIDSSDARFARVVQRHTFQLSAAGLYEIREMVCARVAGIRNAPAECTEMNSRIRWDGSSANTPITFNFSAVQIEVVRGQDYAGNLSAVPAPGITLSYDQSLNQSITSQPPGFSINTSTGALSIPAASTATYLDNTAGNAGADYAFSGNIIASDGSKVEFDWMFDAVSTGSANRAPDANNAMVNATVGQTVTHTFTGSDPDGNALTWSFNQILGPGGAAPLIAPTFNAATQQLTWNTTGSATGTWSLQVQARDPGGLTDIGVLTVNLGIPVPRTNGKIVFANVEDSGGSGEIYCMNPDGTGVIRLTNNPGADGGPAWSQDGSRIAFWNRATSDAQSEEIFVMNADGSGQTQLTTNSVSDRNPQFSPNGTRIVYQHLEPAGGWEIYVMNANGTGQTRLTNNSEDDTDPQWSPDGNRIVFSSGRSQLGIDIWVMNADGTAPVQLTSLVDAHDFSPDWSPDGTKIVFFRRGLPGPEAIWIMSADGTGQARVSVVDTVPRSRPVFSPDGTKIHYYQNPPNASTGNVVPVTINPDGSGEMTIVTSAFPRLGTDPDWGSHPSTDSGPFLALASDFFGDLWRFRVPTVALVAGDVISSGKFVQRLGNTGIRMEDIALDSSGKLFGVDATSTLYSIDLATAVPTAIGTVGAPVNALTFGPDAKLYAAGSSLYTINTMTGLGTLVGPLSGFVSEGDLAFDETGALFMTTTTDQLVRVDPATGAATAVAATLGRGTGNAQGNYDDVTGLFFGPDKTLYGVSQTLDQFLSLNRATAFGASHDILGALGNATGATLAPRVGFDIFACDATGKLFRINALTGTVIVVGNMGTVMTDLAQNASGALFGVNATSSLFSINSSTGAATQIGAVGAAMTSLAFSPAGTLYAAGEGGLYTIETATGQGTRVVDIVGSSSVGDLAFDSLGRLFMTTPSNESFQELDPVTGIGELPRQVLINDFTQVFGLVFGPDGVMYGLSNATQQLFTLDHHSSFGSPALWVNYGTSQISGTFGAATPPPASRSSIEFSASDFQVNEDAGTATITISRTGKADTEDTIRYSTSDGTAIDGQDYDATSGVLTFAPGETSRSFTITIRDDSTDESDETVNLTISTPTGASSLGAVRTATLTILDNDGGGGGGCVAAPAGLVNWFPGDGNANDLVGGNNGTLVGGTSFAAGKVGQAFSFDGTDDGVRVAASTSLNVGAGGGFTIEAWINPSTLGQRGPIVEWVNGVHLWTSVFGTGNLFANISDGGNHTVTSAGSSLTAGTYQHVALTYDKASGTATLYINGAAAGQANLGSFTPRTTTDLYLGERAAGSFGEGQQSFPGLIDEVTIYNRALAAAEIQGIFNADNAGKCPPVTNPTVSIDPTSMTEGNSGTADAVFNVRLSVAASQAVVLNFQTENDTATAGSDYVARTDSVTISAGETTGTIRIAVNGDTTSEPDESFSVRLVSATGATIAATAGVATGTILDNDGGGSGSSPLLGFYPLDGSACDASGNGRNGTATNGAMPVNDGIENGAYRFDPTDTVGDFISVPVDINPSAQPKLTMGLWARSNSTSGGTALSHDSGGFDRTIDIDFRGGGTGWSAFSGTGGVLGFVPVQTGEWTFLAAVYDQVAATVTLYVEDKIFTESGTLGAGNTSLRIGSNPFGDFFNGSIDNVFVFGSALGAAQIDEIRRDRSAGIIRIGGGQLPCGSLPTVSLDPTAVTEGNSGTTDAVFNVRLSAAALQAVTVNYQTENGTATAGSDYAASTNSITIAAGQTTGTIRIPVTGDSIDELDETFSVRIVSATNATVPANTTAVGTINDDDPAPVVSIDSVSVTEGNSGTTDADFNVQLSAASSQAVVVNFQTENGTATAGSDYAALNSFVTIPAGQTTSTILIQVTGDSIDEPDETFSVRIVSASNATVPANTVADGTINDDEPTVIPALSINDVSVTEGNTGKVNAVFTITPSFPPTQPLRVTYSTTAGTASASSDFDGVGATTMTINAGQTSLLVTVQVNGDTIDEIDETFVVNITSPDGAFLLDGQGAGTIRDDDAPPGGQIRGMKFEDRDGDAVRDLNEPGLPGWVIFLDNNNNGVRDGGIETNTRNAGGLPQPIPGAGTVLAPLVVTGPLGSIRDVNVRLDITHSFAGDLAFTLVGPSGTRVQLVAEDSLPPLELDEDNFTNTTFDDEATTPITSGEAPFTGSFRPMNPLSVLDGQFAAGTWTLEIIDTADRDEGTLDGWSLTLQTDETERSVTTDAAGNFSFDSLAAGSYRVREVQQTDWFQTTSNPNPIAITAGSIAAGINFGNRRDTQGPIIDRIDLVRDARGRKVLAVVLTVNERLSPAGAGNVANYQLDKVSRRSRKPVPISLAVYNDAARTVTLNLRKTISAAALASYELTVRDTGSLTDLFNNRLDGNRDGAPGGDFVRSLSPGTILSVVDELLESGELTGRHRLSESLESSLAHFIGRSKI